MDRICCRCGINWLREGPDNLLQGPDNLLKGPDDLLKGPDDLLKRAHSVRGNADQEGEELGEAILPRCKPCALPLAPHQDLGRKKDLAGGLRSR